MVLIPAGTFEMGLTISQLEYVCSHYLVCAEVIEYDFRNHSVRITRDFWIDAYEVTNDDYQRCVEEEVCTPLETLKSQLRDTYYLDYPDYPVTVATWFQADTVCRVWRGGRLPTEAEWEYAARGTDGRLWPWGNELPDGDLLNFLPYEYQSEVARDTTEVGAYRGDVSPFGLYDMAGNVREWVADWYDEYPNESVIDPVGPNSGARRIVRGGHYLQGALEAMTTSRFSQDPHKVFFAQGIRCVKDRLP